MFHALATWTTCANLHQNRFTYFQNIVFTGVVTDEWTDKRMDQHNASATKSALKEA